MTITSQLLNAATTHSVTLPYQDGLFNLFNVIMPALDFAQDSTCVP